MPHAARLWLPAFCLVFAPAPTFAAEQDQYEERTLMRSAERGAERALRAAKSDRAQWVKALEAALPDKFTAKVAGAATDDEHTAWFNLLAGKSGDWRRDETTNAQLVELYDLTLRRLELGPVPSIKRDEFAKYARRALAPGTSKNQDGDFNEDADKVFRVLDKNGNGDLETDELTIGLKEDKVRTDTDGNGRITKEEYRGYFKRKVAVKVEAFVAKHGGEPLTRSGGKTDGKPGADGMPDWFGTLDADKDKQLSLFEWREGNKPTELFQEMDLDDDGLLTRDEYLRYLKKKQIELDQKRREEGRP